MEILISIGILVTLLALTTPFTVEFYRRYQIDAERNLFLSLLREARTMSLAGYGSASHGVRVDAIQFTLFEGTSYATRNPAQDETFPRTDAVTITGPTEVVFAYLVGFSTASTSYALTNGAKQSIISINYAGSIDWQ